MGALIALGLMAAPALASPLGEVSLFSSGISNDHGYPEEITTGLEGNLWFTESGQGSTTSEDIGRLEPLTGQITEFSSGITPSRPAEAIATGPEGDLWFTQFYGEQVGRIDPATGIVTEFPVGNSPDRDRGIIAGPDGGIWFAQGYSDRIGRINPKTGAVTEYSSGISGSPGPGTSGPWQLAWGPEGDLWFTQVVTSQIGRLNPATGVITEYSPGLDPERIVAGSDGNLWFTGSNGAYAALGRISPTTGQVTTFPLSSDGTPEGLASGPEGDVWFGLNETGGHVIGRILPASGHMEEFPKSYNSGAYSLTSGPGNSMWFTGPLGAIGEIGTEGGLAPAVTTQPASLTVTAPGTATFAVACSGVNAPTVQWEESTNGTNWALITGATSNSLSISPTSLSESGTEYRATCTNVEGTAQSVPAQLTVYTVPVIDSSPANATVVSGETATFSSTAHGTPTPTVQWQVSSDHGATWSFLPGASSGTLQLSNVTAAQNGLEYRAVWTSSGGATDSQPAMLTVNTAPVIDESPASLAVAEGDDAVFTSAASGNPAPTVQWELSTNQGASWTPVPGASASSLTVNSVTLAQTGAEYRAVWTNVVRSVPSSAATLTVDARPTVAMVGASAITATSAILNGTVDPNGAIVESCAFRWGTNPDPRQFEESEECESLPAGLAGAQAVSTLAEGLEPNTTYYYYLKADNALGDSDGVASEVFTTLASSGSGTSSGVSAVARDGTLSATAGGSSGSVTVGHYGSAFTGTGPLRGNGEFFDVYLSSGNTFSKLEFTVCGLQPSDTLEWDNGGAWDKVERQKHEVGSPGCVEVEIEGPGDGTSPELAQMTGTIFAVVTPAESLPVVGRCTKLPGTKVGRTTVYDGAYTSNKCITKNLAGTGGYEWTPATGSNAFVGTGATVTIDAGGKPRITCRAISDSGAYSGTDQETTDITLSECATSGRGATSCHSAGQGAGAIAWSPLAGGIGLVNAVQAQAGVDFAAPAAGEPLASFECGGTAERLEGSVIGEASVDTSSIRQSVKFKAVRGAQAIQALEGGATDTLTLASGPGFSHTEPAALSGTLEQETTEPLEIKALLAPFSLTASATSGPVGSTVKLTGSGYIPGDTITPKFQGNNPVPHEPKITTTYPPVTVNASGEFEAEITIPTTVGIGAGKLSITSRHTGATLTETFNVTPPTT